MTDPLRDTLQDALGSAYSLKNELGGGGMSRVFIAREEALGRDVVIKALAPELAEGLGVERFAREIRLAASLQEPHIVPVLSAGVASGGIPYYTMLFVRGASLRERLDQGPIGADEALHLLRDVAPACRLARRLTWPSNTRPVIPASISAPISIRGVLSCTNRSRESIRSPSVRQR